MEIEYVMSGTQDRIIPNQTFKDYGEAYINDGITMLTRYMRYIEGLIKNETTNTVHLSRLYNGYMESSHGADLAVMYDDVYHNLYADSGGLQVITQGKQVTPEMKSKIYTSQDCADFSFCFDEIPVTVKCSLAGNDRSNITNKLFVPENFVECAKKTAHNIVEQCQSLKNSQAFIIVQGNTVEDMILWVDTIYPIVEPYLDKIAGFAPADTCMGNGYLESCDMVYAVSRILEKYPLVKRRVHFLGIGSASRIEPIVRLSTQGVLPADCIVSIDSSSMTMSFIMGKSVNSYKDNFREFVNFMTDFFKLEGLSIDNDLLYNAIHDNQRESSAVQNTVYTLGDDYRVLAQLIVPMYCHWQVYLTFKKMHKDMTSGKDKISRSLDLIDGIDGYMKWRSTFGHKVHSRRISRKSSVSLLDFFSEN